MGAYYFLSGILRLEDDEEVRNLLGELESLAGTEAISVEEKDGNLVIDVRVDNYYGYSTISEIDQTVEDLGPYTIGVCKLYWSCEEEKGRIYIARTPSEAEEAESKATLDEDIVPLLRHLKRHHLLKLQEMVQRHVDQAVPVTYET